MTRIAFPAFPVTHQAEEWRRGRIIVIDGRVTVILILGISVALGGLVLAGSSVGSTKQFERALKRTEAERNAAIDGLAFIEVDDNRGERPD